MWNRLIFDLIAILYWEIGTNLIWNLMPFEWILCLQCNGNTNTNELTWFSIYIFKINKHLNAVLRLVMHWYESHLIQMHRRFSNILMNFYCLWQFLTHLYGNIWCAQCVFQTLNQMHFQIKLQLMTRFSHKFLLNVIYYVISSNLSEYCV